MRMHYFLKVRKIQAAVMSDGSETYQQFMTDETVDTAGVESITTLFHFLEQRYGECEGRIYKEVGGKKIHTGWCFVKHISKGDATNITKDVLKMAKGAIERCWVCVYSEKPKAVIVNHRIDIETDTVVTEEIIFGGVF